LWLQAPWGASNEALGQAVRVLKLLQPIRYMGALLVVADREDAADRIMDAITPNLHQEA
jgi:hypothetical protein